MAHFKKIDADRYNDMLTIMDPQIFRSYGFLINGMAFFRTCPDDFDKAVHGMVDEYFEAIEDMTAAQFEAVRVSTIRANLI